MLYLDPPFKITAGKYRGRRGCHLIADREIELHLFCSNFHISDKFITMLGDPVWTRIMVTEPLLSQLLAMDSIVKLTTGQVTHMLTERIRAREAAPYHVNTRQYVEEMRNAFRQTEAKGNG